MTLLPSVSVSVVPSIAVIYSGATQQFGAILANAVNPAVTWSVTPSGIGTIDATGLYTAPGIVAGIQTITITATSVTDPTKSGSATLTLEPGQGTSTVSTGFGAALDLVAQALCRSPHNAPAVSAGVDQSVDLSTSNSASVTLSGAATNYSLEPGQSLSYVWSLATGPAPVQIATPNAASTQVNFTVAGTYTFQLTIDDGLVASTGLTHVVVIPAQGAGYNAVYVTPSSSGPNAVGTPVSLRISLPGFTQAEFSVTVTGANPQTTPIRSVWDSNGNATFTYTGHNPGTDTVTVTLFEVPDPTAVTVTWINPNPPQVTTSPVNGQFFAADGSGTFNMLGERTADFRASISPVSTSIPRPAR